MLPLLRQILVRALLLAALGLVAVGVSGAVAAVMDVVAGHAFVVGDPDDRLASPARCAEYREYAPGAPTCLAAAEDHHARELFLYRTAAGVLGGVALVAWAVTRRRRPEWFATDRLPAAFTETVAAVAFGVAAVGQFALAADVLGHGDPGAGQWLSAAVVAAVAAGLAAFRFTRRATARPA